MRRLSLCVAVAVLLAVLPSYAQSPATKTKLDGANWSSGYTASSYRPPVEKLVVGVGASAAKPIVVPTEAIPAMAAAAGSTCSGGAAHCTTLSWTEATSAPAGCTIGYNVFRGTAAGAESTTPLNATLLSATSYQDPATLTGTPQTFFYVAQAVETCSGIAQASANSNEVSSTFPGIPAAPAMQAPVAN